MSSTAFDFGLSGSVHCFGGKACFTLRGQKSVITFKIHHTSFERKNLYSLPEAFVSSSWFKALIQAVSVKWGITMIRTKIIVIEMELNIYHVGHYFISM